VLVCAQCGRENPDDARFCAACGARLGAAAAARREERKVVSILFADLVGFTSRSEQLDPEDVRATLSPYYSRLRAELERHGGTVEKFIGDAVMAVFGAPVAHEDDPERAVRAALAIRDAIIEDGRLQVRVAVTTGEALVTLGASPAEGEGMVAGDVVNTAARLQSAAPVNGVLVDETTHRATRQWIDYAATEPVEAKGKSDPVRVWEAREARSRFGVDVVQTGASLVGRHREVELLAGALARARDERAPQLVTLAGVPGIGKSRLVYELQQLVDAQPDLIYWRQGRSLPYGDGVTYWALAEMAKAQAGVLESDAPDAAARKLAESVALLGLDDRVLESLRSLVGVGGEERRGDRSEHFAAWRQFFEALAEERPTVLVFEDLHWANDDLLDFVDHLVDWATGVPLLVVCTARPELLERRPGWGGGKSNALILSISPLSDGETAQLLGALLARAVLPAETQSALLARAGGNPLYAEQFARLLEESDGDELLLPENVQGIIAARLDGLQPTEKQLLQDAAVVGKVFWLGAVCAVGERAPAGAEAALHALERKEFVRRERRASVGGEEEYAFRHVLVRDVAYGQIPRGDRAQRHARAARWIESLGRPEDHGDMLAHHYLESLRLAREAGAEPSEELVASARRASRDAGDRALALGAFPAAARMYEAALELTPAGGPGRADLLLAYARSRADDVGLDEALLLEATEQLLSEGRVEAAAEAQARLGGVLMSRAEGERALASLEHAAELVADQPASREKAFVLQEHARLLAMAEDFDRAIPIARESLHLAEELGAPATRARNLNTLGCARVAKGDRGGLEDLERAVEIAAAAHSHEEVGALANLTWMHVLLGDLRGARPLHERSLEAARRMGLEAYLRWQEAEEVLQRYWDGSWDDALSAADHYLLQVGRAGTPYYMEGICRSLTAAISLARGDRDGAWAEARRATEVSRPTKDPQTVNPSLVFEAQAALAVGETGKAGALADELVASWAAVGIRQPHELSVAPWVFRELGRAQELLAALEAETRSITRWHEAGRFLATGELVSGAEVFAEIGSVPDEAYTRLRAAEAAVAAGDRAGADVQLALALPAISRLGASAWATEGELLLAESA
jgi:class 3 adenylate cyclase/predicted ATPase